MPKHLYFSSDIIYNQSFEAIDTEKGIIKGVTVCSEGEAKGHGVWLNKKFIRDVTRFGKDHEVGIKARFGHPNMCATALGTYIGRYKNYRTQTEEKTGWEDGKRYHSVADLYLDETSKNLPKLGNAWDYIIKLAKTSPDMFGNSIVFTPGETEEKKTKNDDGTESVRYDANIEQLHATDLVDEPAATEGLFPKFEKEELAMQVTEFLNSHPEVYDLAVNHPDIVTGFLQKYETYKEKYKSKIEPDMDNKTLLAQLKEFITGIFTAKKEDGTEGVTPKEVTDKLNLFEESLTALSQENESLKTDLQTEKDARAQSESEAKINFGAKEKNYQDKITAFEAKVTGLETEIIKLQASGTKPAGIVAGENPEFTGDLKMKEWDDVAGEMKKSVYQVHDEQPDLNAKINTK